MDGEIIKQRSSYRQGLVLGLTMAEIMLLLVFCLLIAMASFLKTEHTKRVAAEQNLLQQQEQNQRDRKLVTSIRENGAVYKKLQGLSGSSDPAEIDKYWRELVDSKTAMDELKNGGLLVNDIRAKLADIDKVRSDGINVEKAVRDADIVGAINSVMTKLGQPQASKSAILETIEKGASSGPGPSGHQWPPIITLSEANGNFFKSGSAELSQGFQSKLTTSISRRFSEEH